VAYAPKDKTAWDLPVAGNESQWASLISNDGELYREVSSVFLSAVTAGTAISLTSSPTAALYFGLPRNKDNNPVVLVVQWSQSGTPGADTVTLTLEITDGTDTDSATVTSTLAGYFSSITVSSFSSSGSDTPRLCTLKVSGDNSQNLYIQSVFAYVAGTGPSTGVLDSSYVGVDSLWDDTNAPVPSEVCSTLYNNAFHLASDRINCGVCFIEELGDLPDRAKWVTDESAFPTVVGRYVVPEVLPGLRKYRLWVAFESTGDAVPSLVFGIGSQAIEVSYADGFSVGVSTTTFTATKNDIMAGIAGGNFVMLKVASGSGYVVVRTLQLFEEPS